MPLVRILMRAVLVVPYGFRMVTATGPFGPHGPRYIAASVMPDGNPLKTALWRHHVKQYNEASCSVATVVSVINALRSLEDPAASPIGQRAILDAVTAANWKARMGRGGDNGRRGLPLPLLWEVVKRSLAVYGVSHAAVEMHPAVRHAATGAFKAGLHRRLTAFERDGSCVVIAHFDQGALVRALNIPHISPVGGYDPDSGRVTVLDVDPDQERPYRVGFNRFYRALSSDYHHLFRPFGYGSGGYVCIRLA